MHVIHYKLKSLKKHIRKANKEGPRQRMEILSVYGYQ
jgi:hypothetical protein